MLDIERNNTIEDTLPRLQKKGDLLAIVQFPHPADAFLFIVLIDSGSEFIVWLFNNQTGGCSDGTYFTYSERDKGGMKREAYRSFIERTKLYI